MSPSLSLPLRSSCSLTSFPPSLLSCALWGGVDPNNKKNEQAGGLTVSTVPAEGGGAEGKGEEKIPRLTRLTSPHHSELCPVAPRPPESLLGRSTLRDGGRAHGPPRRTNPTALSLCWQAARRVYGTCLLRRWFLRRVKAEMRKEMNKTSMRCLLNRRPNLGRGGATLDKNPLKGAAAR